MIQIGAPFTIYANPAPLLVSRQAAFPGIAASGDGGLVAMFPIGQAFDAADMRSHVCRSDDGGRSWSAPKPMHGGPKGRASETFKPLLLADGRMIATGYVFHRPDALTPIVDPETLELLPMSNRVSWSHDGGHNWTVPRDFTVEGLGRGVGLELSGPAIQTSDGRILAAAPPFHLRAKDQAGWLIESRDGGESWRRLSVFYRAADGATAPWEARLAELAPGLIAVLFWAYDCAGQRNLDNLVVLSGDGGQTFGPAIATGIRAQASGILALGDGGALTIHAHREPPVGLILRRVSLDGDRFTVHEEYPLLAPATEGVDTSGIGAQFGSLKFGQPGLVHTAPGRVLAYWWQIEDGQHVIKGAGILLDGSP